MGRETCRISKPAPGPIRLAASSGETSTFDKMAQPFYSVTFLSDCKGSCIFFTRPFGFQLTSAEGFFIFRINQEDLPP